MSANQSLAHWTCSYFLFLLFTQCFRLVHITRFRGVLEFAPEEQFPLVVKRLALSGLTMLISRLRLGTERSDDAEPLLKGKDLPERLGREKKGSRRKVSCNYATHCDFAACCAASAVRILCKSGCVGVEGLEISVLPMTCAAYRLHRIINWLCDLTLAGLDLYKSPLGSPACV